MRTSRDVNTNSTSNNYEQDRFTDVEFNEDAVYMNAGGSDEPVQDDWFIGFNSNSMSSSDDSGILVEASHIKSSRMKEVKSFGRPETGRIVRTALFGIFVSSILGLITLGLYAKWIKYPNEMLISEKSTGLYCLEQWQESIKSIEALSEDSYIRKEVSYANGSELKVKFLKRMLETVSYTPSMVYKKNIYGNNYIDKSTNQPIQVVSCVEVGEDVEFSYVDYNAIVIDESLLKTLMDKYNLKLGDVNYENILVDVFCEYMISLPTVPVKKVSRAPELVKDGDSYSLLPEEDIYLDKILFSSREFWSLLNRFSNSAAKVSSGTELVPLQNWVEWNNFSEEQKSTIIEPNKYSYKQSIGFTWCGAYYLSNEYQVMDANGNIIKKGISANVGKGTFEEPAGLDTSVVTYVFVKEKGKKGKSVTNKYPIRVTLRDYRVSQDAIAWFESKDIRNRGIDVTSEVQYCAYSIEVTNLSPKTLTISDNSILCDENANIFSRSGEIFGLCESVVLEPDQSGVIESWCKSTELNKKYLIWGKDFERRESPIWFRVLMGNIEDASDEKGVTINNSRSSKNTQE